MDCCECDVRCKLVFLSVSIYTTKVWVLSWSRILEVLVSEGVVSVSEGVVSVWMGRSWPPTMRSWLQHWTQCNVPQVKINALPLCSSWCRQGNSRTATHCNADAVEVNSMRTTCWLVKINILSFIEPISEGVSKNSLLWKFVMQHFLSLEGQ